MNLILNYSFFLVETKKTDNVLTSTLKLINLMLYKGKSKELDKIMQDKVAVENVITFYSLAKFYNIVSVSESSLLYIERCFPVIVETRNFLHFDFDLVVKVLSSSKLNIHSEVEVFNAANAWLKHNSKERGKYATQLLLKVRLQFLSQHAFKHILNCNSLLTKNIEHGKTLKEVLLNQKTFSSTKTNNYYTSRYCSQNKFNIVLFSGKNLTNRDVRKVYQVDVNNLNNVKSISSMKEERLMFKTVCLKGQVYVFGGKTCAYMLRNAKNIEKYSPSTNEWTVVTNLFDERENFCTCSFIDKILVFGGSYYNYNEGHLITLSCSEFNTNDNSFKELSGMNVARSNAACAVFKGNVIVCGGYDTNNLNYFNSVESYDVFADKWSPMSNMVYNHSFHSLVAVKNKLFVISRNNTNHEVFDCASKKFFVLKPHPDIIAHVVMNCVAIGNKILMFLNQSSKVICYDVDKDEWSEESCGITKDLFNYSCVKMPEY